VAALPQVQRKLRKLEEVDQQLARRLELGQLGGVVHLDLVIGSLVSLELHFAFSWSGKSESAGAACFI